MYAFLYCMGQAVMTICNSLVQLIIDKLLRYINIAQKFNLERDVCNDIWIFSYA